MQIPGVMRIADWIICKTIEKLEFYPEWQANAKVMLQTFHSQKLRECVCDKLQLLDIDEADKQALIRSLQKGTGKFAHWRWRTLWDAVHDLLRIEGAVRAFTATVQNPAKDMAIRVQGRAQLIKDIGQSEHFWHCCNIVKVVLKPLMTFASWARGCHCHETDNVNVSCPFKGCRAPHIAARVDIVLSELHLLRSQLAPGQFGPVDVTDVQAAVTEAMYLFKLKMQWVSDPPYLIWQAAGNRRYPQTTLCSINLTYWCVS